MNNSWSISCWSINYWVGACGWVGLGLVDAERVLRLTFKLRLNRSYDNKTIEWCSWYSFINFKDSFEIVSNGSEWMHILEVICSESFYWIKSKMQSSHFFGQFSDFCQAQLKFNLNFKLEAKIVLISKSPTTHPTTRPIK